MRYLVKSKNGIMIDTRLEANEAQEIIKIINNCSTALNLLGNYDHDRIIKNTGTL